MALTREMVCEAADKLVAAGVTPSLRLIRESLGTGSFATIRPMLAEWRHAQVERTPAIAEPLPAAIEQRISEACLDVWQAAMAAASALVVAERQALAEAREASESASIESAEVADQLVGELEQARAHQAELESLVEKSQATSRDFQLQLVVEQSRSGELAHQMERADQELSTLRARLDEAHRQSAESHGRYEELNSLRAALRESSLRGEK